MRINSFVLPLSVSLILSGCSIGYDTAIYGTKTNFGLDIDTKPATAEISISRKELAIQPTFPGSSKNGAKYSQNTLPMISTFGLSGKFFDPKITANFSGGKAATTLVGGNEEDSYVCLATI